MFRVLFLCTGNSARSQMAEALLNWKAEGVFTARAPARVPLLSRRIDLLVALPIEKLERRALEARVRAIGRQT